MATPRNIAELTDKERKAIAKLQSLADEWPQSLVLFASGGALSIRKPKGNEFYSISTEVASVSGIRNDGGDGGD